MFKVVLEWDNENEQDANSVELATYTIALSPEIVTEIDLNRDANIVFSIGTESQDQREPLDLTIELCDGDGNCAALPLSSVGPVHPALRVRLAKWEWLEKKNVENFSERLLQTYEMPILSFLESNSSFEPSRLKSIRFLFDRSDKGFIMLDDIGFSK